ncbi:hypothetical protein GCM10010406_02290 [Streptomyces thermolineatus]|uniref:Uncharacterized protein n=1 Tax=Streptomyces thermolineatus TaxID=44033 RepID=A0ABN3KW18_9ACTN
MPRHTLGRPARVIVFSPFTAARAQGEGPARSHRAGPSAVPGRPPSRRAVTRPPAQSKDGPTVRVRLSS